uniref:Uncharacterized protein n=1 Tax=Manihot esculenta TaxID=3983 RepID=A0A2C9VGJ4_MANES
MENGLGSGTTYPERCECCKRFQAKCGDSSCTMKTTTRIDCDGLTQIYHLKGATTSL